MNSSARAKPALILCVGAFFALAPLWAKHVQTIAGHGIFGTPDAMVLLGITLIVSLLGYYLLPDFLVSNPRCTTRRTPYAVRLPLLLVGLLSLVGLVYVLYLVNQHILHSFLSSADEHSCYFLAECLRKGKLYVDIPPLADFFKVVHVGMRDGKWFSVYPPGWPLIWALGLNFNIVDWLNPVMSSLAVFFFYLSGIRLFSRWSVVCGLLVCVLSPFFMFTAASYFSHATCLLCISVFLYAFLRWHETRELVILRRPLPKDPTSEILPSRGAVRMTGRGPSETPEIFWASLCAFAVGYGLITRYLTMAAVAAPFLLYHFWHYLKNTGCCQKTPGVKWVLGLRFKLRRSDWTLLGFVFVFMALILYQNYLVTGSPLLAPNTFDKEYEKIGFRIGYLPSDGFSFLFARIFYLMDWFAPAFVGVYLVIVFQMLRPAFVILSRAKDLAFGFFSSQKSGSTQNDEFKGHKNANGADSIQTLFLLTPVFLGFAYFFYFSWGGNQWGPRYWWEGMPFLCIAVADWLVRLWQDRGLRVKKFVLAFIVMSLVTSGLIFVRQAEYVEESSRQRRALYDLAEETIQGQAIVFIHGFIGSRLVMAEEDTTRNSPFLDDRILYVHDLGDRNKELMAAHPDREYYRGTYDRERLLPELERID